MDKYHIKPIGSFWVVWWMDNGYIRESNFDFYSEAARYKREREREDARQASANALGDQDQ